MDCPWEAAGSSPRVDLDALARVFTAPFQFAESLCGSYWKGVDLIWETPSPLSSPRPPDEVFREVVDGLCVNKRKIAIQFSGGLDSLAVLLQVRQTIPDDGILLFHAGLTDDCGVASEMIASRILKSIDFKGHFETVPLKAEHADSGTWSAYGPKMTTFPGMHEAISRLAAERGADILLNGDGADELVSTHNFATLHILRRSGLRSGWRYFRDAGMSDAGYARELAAIVSGLLPAEYRLKLYLASNWAGLLDNELASRLLGATYRDSALHWAEQWAQDLLHGHIEKGLTWMSAERLDAWWPQPYIPPASSLEEASPFLDTTFISNMRAVPTHELYRPSERTQYHRVKGIITGLIRQHENIWLPPNKQLFSKMVSEFYNDHDFSPHVIHQVGLLERDNGLIEQDTKFKMTVRAVENWLRGAIERGALVEKAA